MGHGDLLGKFNSEVPNKFALELYTGFRPGTSTACTGIARINMTVNMGNTGIIWVIISRGNALFCGPERFPYVQEGLVLIWICAWNNRPSDLPSCQHWREC